MKTRLLSLNSSRFWRYVLSLAVCTIIAGPSIAFAREHSSPTVGSATAANEPNEPSPPNPSPHDYQNYTCDQISAEMDFTADQIRVLQETQKHRISLARPHVSSGEKAAWEAVGIVARAHVIGLITAPIWIPLSVAEEQRRTQEVEQFLNQFNENLQTGHMTLDVLETAAREKACAVPMTAKITKWSNLAREKARASCKVTGLPVLKSITGNFEDYRVPCNFAVPLNVRCDSSGCRETPPSSEMTKASMANNDAINLEVSGQPLRVAILQVGFLPGHRIRFLDSITDSLEFTEELINENPLLDLKHAYYSGEVLPPVKNAFGFIPGSYVIWGKERYEPLKHALFDHWRKNKPDVDIIFAAGFEIGLASPFERQSGIEGKLISSDVYLVDIPRRQMYFVKGGNTADQIQQSIEELFSGYLKSIGMTAPEPVIDMAKLSQAPGDAKLRIAVLPFWGSSTWHSYVTWSDEWLENLSHDILMSNDEFEPGFSFYRDKSPSGIDFGIERIWRVSGSKRLPDETALAQIGTALSVDGILLLQYHLFGSNYDNMRDAKAIVFDVSSQRMYSIVTKVGSVNTSDREDKVGFAIRSALSKFVAGHENREIVARLRPRAHGKPKPQLQNINADAPPAVALARARSESAQTEPEADIREHELPKESARQPVGKISENPSTISVAIFPFAGQAIVVNDAENLLPEFANKYVSQNRQLQLFADYFGNNDSKIGGYTDYWNSANKPAESRIYKDASSIGADAVLMYSYSGQLYMEDRFNVTVYVLDVRNRRVYQSAGNQDNYKAVTNRLFEDLIASR